MYNESLSEVKRSRNCSVYERGTLTVMKKFFSAILSDTLRKLKEEDGFIFFLLLILFLMGVFSFSGYKAYTIVHNYNVAEKEYDDLANTYAVSVEDEVPADVQEGSSEEAAESSSSSFHAHNQLVRGRILKIDFDALQAENEQVIGWLLLDGAGINYPVLKGEDNDYYLHHTFSGEYNSSGSVFMDFENNPDFSDYNTFIYGHNMKNGSMFGSMQKYFTGKDCEGEQYFYIFLPNGHRATYQVYSCYVTHSTSDTYRLFYTEEDYHAYMEMIAKKSIRQTELDPGKEILPIVTLSTCSGAAGGTQRFVVHGLLVDDVDLSGWFDR